MKKVNKTSGRSSKSQGRITLYFSLKKNTAFSTGGWEAVYADRMGFLTARQVLVPNTHVAQSSVTSK